jgi:peptidoglycan/LPS O-acetylase OafA/YrhL
MAIFDISNLIILIFILCLALSSFTISKIQLSHTTFDSLARSSSLDGLRGILALTVLVHHFFITYMWKTTGVWDHPDNKILDNFGAIPVSLFFLITGYLFINKLKSNDVNWLKVFKSRIKRIVPLYTLVAIIVVVLTLLTVNLDDYSSKQIFKWLKGWMLFNGKSLGDFQSSIIIAGVNWTLLYEWGFYFSLPIIHAIYHKKIIDKRYLFIAFIIFLTIFLETNRSLYLLFLLAVFPILFEEKIKNLIARKRRLVDIALLLIINIAFIFTTHFSTTQKLLTALVFAFVCNGYDFCKILNNKGLRVLGDISYSTYLLHGLVLYLFYSVFDFYNFDNGMLGYFMTFPLVFIVVILLSFVSYKYVEKPLLKR